MTSISLYLRDAEDIFTSAEEHDPMGPVPARAVTVAPPSLAGTEVARWIGTEWEVLHQRPRLTSEQISAEHEAVVAARWELIKVERDAVRATGGVKAGGHWFHTDIDSRVKWLGLKDSARDMRAAGAPLTDLVMVKGTAVHWKTMTGVFVPVTAQLALDVVEAVKALDAELFVRAEQHYAAVRTSQAPANYDYSTGWPVRFVDLP